MGQNDVQNLILANFSVWGKDQRLTSQYRLLIQDSSLSSYRSGLTTLSDNSQLVLVSQAMKNIINTHQQEMCNSLKYLA